MKRVSALFIVAALIFSLSACSNKNDTAGASSIVASYSVKSADGEFIVEVQKNMGGVYDEIYDENGIYIKFKGGSDEIYDAQGNKISRKDLNYGDTLEIQYDGTLADKNPKTIKAYKIIKMM